MDNAPKTRASQTPITDIVYGKQQRSRPKTGTPRPQKVGAGSLLVDLLPPETREALIGRLPKRMRLKWGVGT